MTLTKTSTFPYLDNTNIDLRLISYPSSLSPGSMFNSASRMEMLSKHWPQHVVVHGSEFPEVFTGTEYDFGQYTFNTSKRDQDVEILLTVPRYNAKKIPISPYYVIVCRGLQDNKIHYFKIDRYFMGCDGFGYENKIRHENFSKLNKYNVIPKDIVFAESPNIKGSEYCCGANANTIYATFPETIQDAMLISESFAEKLSSTAIHKKTITIKANMYPINTYGNSSEPKFLPEIGEAILGDTLCAFRTIEADTFAADQDPAALCTIYPQSDTVFKIEKGSKILDIQFYSKKDNIPPAFSQMDKYRESDIEYHTRIVEHYCELTNSGISTNDLSPSYSTLVTNSINQLIALNAYPKRLTKININRRGIDIKGDNSTIVDNIQITVTYSYKRKVEKGYKITDRNGNKGVLAAILPDHMMPIDGYGVRADLVTSPDATVKRMNFGQLYEHGLSSISKAVLRQCASLPSVNEKFDTIMDWQSDVNSNFAELLKTNITTNQDKNEYVNECMVKGIRLHVPPSLKTPTPNNMLAWRKKWNAHPSRIKFSIKIEHPNRPKEIVEITSLYEFTMGVKYIYLLCKIPQSSAVSASYVNQIGLPMKPASSQRHSSIVTPTPGRWGEDENRIFNMVGLRSDIMRFLRLQSTSPEGTSLMYEQILTVQNPVDIQRVPISDFDLYQSSSINALIKHILVMGGIDANNMRATFKTPATLIDLENTLEDEGTRFFTKQRTRYIRDQKVSMLDDSDDGELLVDDDEEEDLREEKIKKTRGRKRKRHVDVDENDDDSYDDNDGDDNDTDIEDSCDDDEDDN